MRHISIKFSTFDLPKAIEERKVLLKFLPLFRLQVEYHGTLKPAENFNPAEDAETLKKAMKGFG